MPQIKSSLLIALLSWICFPIYVVQGIYVRKTSMRLSPPSVGKWSGQFGKGKAKINLLAVGDSSAAGVGLDDTSQTLGVQLARKLHERTGDSVAWRVSGHNSAVAGEIRDYVVPNIERQAFTHIVVMLGTNDMKNWHTTRRWKKEFGSLLYALRARFPQANIYWHQAIDVTSVPALPQPLGWIMNLRVTLLNRKGAQLCLERGAVCVPPLLETEPAGYCKDGFHANAFGYDVWSDHLLDHFHDTPRTSPAVKAYL